MTRYWLSWYQPSEDYRPINWPPNAAILGYWCSGYTATQQSEPLSLVCALVEADNEEDAWRKIALDWPDMGDRRFCEARSPGYVVNSSRFSAADWMLERMRRSSMNQTRLHPCADCYHFEERAGEQVCRAPEPSEFPLIVDEDCPDYLPVIHVELEAAP